MIESLQDVPRRFSGIAQLYGLAAYQQFSRSHVMVIGIGGVGSWAAEALVRSAIGEVSLIDMDHIAESNINRQIHALDSTLGKAKVNALRDRLTDINADCHIHVIDDFVEAGSPGRYLDTKPDFIIDCIDSGLTKAGVVAYCKQHKQPLITVGGAGGKIDPTQIQITDLSRTTKDSLLSRTRKTLRQQYGFSRNLKRRFGVPAVYSPEQAVGAEPTAPGQGASGLNCSGYGSVTHVTAGFGFIAVGHVLAKLAASS